MNFEDLNKLKYLLNSKENEFLSFYFLNENNKMFLILYQILKEKKMKNLKYNEIYKQIFFNDLNYLNNYLSPGKISNIFLYLKYKLKIKLNDEYYNDDEILNNYLFYLNELHCYINNIFNYYLKSMLELVDSNINDVVDIDIFLDIQEMIDDYQSFVEE